MPKLQKLEETRYQYGSLANVLLVALMSQATHFDASKTLDEDSAIKRQYWKHAAWFKEGTHWSKVGAQSVSPRFPIK